MRLFLAVSPDEQAVRSLADELATTRRRLAAWEDRVRWVPAARVHLTLRFFGDVPDSRLPALVSALGASLPYEPFGVELDGAGVFASRGAVRTIWLTCGTGRAPLIAMHDEVSRRLAAARGWPDDERPFTPHVTIGRVRERRGGRTAGLAEAVSRLSIDPIGWRVDEAVLISSDLSGPQPAYHTVHGVRLAPGREAPGRI